MWRQQKKENPIVSLALLLTLATIPTAANLLVPAPILAQSPGDVPAFPLPQSVENGTTVRIDGSDGLREINQGLKQSFEQQFSGAKVEVTASGTDSALKALQDGNVDLVALSRGLTSQEKAQGLQQVRLRREKIAIVVGAGNPFQGNLTNKQFLKIFRGEITDWSEVGGSQGKIRVIDRPTTSDTRSNLRNYPAFKSTKFVTGANGTQLTEDNTAEIVKQLGNDGISYGLANQLVKLEGVRVLQINQASLDDAKYPFSQPLVYVYKKKPNPGVAGFLGFAIASPGQTAIDTARTTQAQAIAAAVTPPVATSSLVAESTTAATTPPTVSPSQQPAAMSAAKNASATNPRLFLWLLLPVIGGLLLWWFLRRPSSTNPETENVPESTPSHGSEKETNASNTGENITAAGSSATTDTVFPNTSTEDIVNGNPKNSSNSAATITPEFGETAWEIEAPAAIVNNPYPQLPDVPIIASEVELPSTDISTPDPELNNIPEVASPTDNSNIESIPEFREDPPQTENTTATGGAVLAGGAAIAAGTAIWSAASGTESDIQDNNETIQHSNFTELDSPELPEITSNAELPNVDTFHSVAELPEIASNAELPSAVAELPEIASNAELPSAVAELPEITSNAELPSAVPELPAITSNAELPSAVPELPEITSNAELPNVDTFHSEAELPEITSNAELPNVDTFHSEAELPEITSNAELPNVDTFHSVPELPEITSNAELPNVDTFHSVAELPEITSNAELPNVDTFHSVPELPELAELELNAVADAAEPTTNLTEEDTGSDLPEALASGAALAAGAGIATWASIYGIQNASESNPQLKTANSPNEEITASIILTPQSPTSVHAAWQISNTQANEYPLALRLSDVTGIDLSYQAPYLVQQYTLDSNIRDRNLTIPVSDRDYITELGHLTPGDNWVSIARSATVRVFSHPYVESAKTAEEITASIILTPQSPTSVHAAWQISNTQANEYPLALRLYDVTGIDLSYQAPHLVQQYTLDSNTRDRNLTIPVSDRDYITELGHLTPGDNWVSIARSATVRVFSHPYVESAKTVEEITASIILTPQSPTSVHAAWQISNTQANEYPLALRLYDVTGIDLSYQAPHLVQQYTLDSNIRDRDLTIPVSDRDYITELGHLTPGDNWVSIARSATVRVFSHPYVESAKTVEEITASIILTPQSPTSVHAAWQISNTQANEYPLALRLYDVTGIDLSYQAPHLVQQYTLDSNIRDRDLTIPVSDRDYITELGHLTPGDNWVSIARSATVRVFSHPYVESAKTVEEITASIILTPQSPTSVHAAWQISNTQANEYPLALRLSDVTGIDLSYQAPHLVQQYTLDSNTRDRNLTIPVSDRDYITELGHLTPGDNWVSIARSATVRVFSHPYVESAKTVEEITASIILTPQSPTSVHAAWQISNTQANEYPLALRLYDVTGIDLSYQAPHLVQQYTLDSNTRDRNLTIPVSDRDYITELGHLTPGDNWVSIARSATVRVFSHPYVESAKTADSPHEDITTSVVFTPRTPKWAYVSWQISDTEKQALQNDGVSQLALRLYDVTGIDLSYQAPHLVQQYELETITRDRFVTIPTSDRDYITEIGHLIPGDRWVSIARSATVRVFSHPHTDFWFIADAELIIHGATEPNASVTIGKHTIKLKPDGTFHLRIPFSDSLIEYLITAAAADGGHAKTIHKKFSQEIPDA